MLLRLQKLVQTARVNIHRLALPVPSTELPLGAAADAQQKSSSGELRGVLEQSPRLRELGVSLGDDSAGALQSDTGRRPSWNNVAAVVEADVGFEPAAPVSYWSL